MKMYTPTHLLLGVAGASLACNFVDKKNWKQLLLGAALGSVLPDVPLMVQMLFNFYEGHKWLLHKSWVALQTGEIFHSLILFSLGWAILEIFFRKNRYVWFLRSWCVSTIFAHIIVDGMTHGSGAWGQAYLWPTNLRLGQYIGFWLYYQHGKPFSVKPAEIITAVTSLIIIILSLWYASRKKKAKPAG